MHRGMIFHSAQIHGYFRSPQMSERSIRRFGAHHTQSQAVITHWRRARRLSNFLSMGWFRTTRGKQHYSRGGYNIQPVRKEDAGTVRFLPIFLNRRDRDRDSGAFFQNTHPARLGSHRWHELQLWGCFKPG